MSLFGNLYQEELPSRAKSVYMYLKDRSNADDQCWPSIKTIAKDTSMSVSTVKRAIEDLVRYDLLTKQFRYRENGSHTSNLYLLKK
ncbi:helix-turn-helix domain-containing protein [Anaerotignum sp. MB30-C6]|uniref:helix-turn-helix domain-containing protein n=1 Tax=Anaerotignum sp. MB30-C6 TaxID=3070814 RepID=UPI0027DE5F9F|nr:helix-turn-helix domain-containing protein [Anaerotignum sp. MB30-C6]WMI82435.1 helix-turn-helix domain-containing protein [Anaerotignum sp. MB30-C6]